MSVNKKRLTGFFFGIIISLLFRNGGILMAVKLRLTRMGAKKRPFYRIIATDSRRPRDGQYLELVGTYAPLDDGEVKINEEVALKWLNSGAIPTTTPVPKTRRLWISHR